MNPDEFWCRVCDVLDKFEKDEGPLSEQEAAVLKKMRDLAWDHVNFAGEEP